jgi:hypothetical protein
MAESAAIVIPLAVTLVVVLIAVVPALLSDIRRLTTFPRAGGHVNEYQRRKAERR